ncbi:hypothetical protein GCM10009734_46580 [Nonomuraea bangladeshensis]
MVVDGFGVLVEKLLEGALVAVAYAGPQVHIHKQYCPPGAGGFPEQRESRAPVGARLSRS